MAETNGITEIDGRRTALTIAKALAAALVAGLFSAVYCWSFWDPAGAMKHVPVGIVNLDEGAVANGEDVNLGADITRHAVEGDAANFVELDADALNEGIENSGCLLVFEIPERFSRDVMSGTDGVPKVADLEVYKNVRYNYIFSQFSSSVEKEFENEIDAAIVNAYVGGAYAGLERARNGFEDASDGAERLASGGDGLGIGLSSLEEGAGSATGGAGSVASGAHDLAEGASVLDVGAQSLADGTEYLADSTQAMPGKTARLASGASSAAEGVADAAEGAVSLSDTARSVQDGLASLSDGLEGGMQRLNSAQSGLSALSAQLEEGSSSADALADGALSARQCYRAAVAAAQSPEGTYDGRTADEWIGIGDAGIQQVSDGASAMSQRLLSASSDAAAGAGALADASEGVQDAVARIGSSDTAGQTLAYGQDRLVSGLDRLSVGLSAAQAGLEDLASGSRTLADSSDVLVSGIQQANDGAQSVAQGAGSMNQGASTLSGGAGALAAALPQIRDGAASAEDGAEQLASGASELVSATAAGADGLSGSLAVDSSDMGAYVADPTNARVEKYGALDHYGQGFAPFFMTTSLWLGALMIFFVIEPLYPKQRGAGRLRTVLGRIPSCLAACALEAAAVTAAAFFIGVPSMYSTSPFLLFGYALSVSVCFMLIMQFLNMTLGVVGKALAVLVLILQLACSGGTLPVELGRGFLASMKPFMPFTYAIDGFRETITYANPSVILGDLGILAAAGMIFLMLSLATWDFAEKRRVVETAQFVAWNA